MIKPSFLRGLNAHTTCMCLRLGMRIQKKLRGKQLKEEVTLQAVA